MLFLYSEKEKNFIKQQSENPRSLDREMNGIVFIKQEESYTSKSSFWDRDDIPIYNADNPKEYSFSGKRMHRGLYKTASGKTINADVNGALNIMRKSRVVDMNILYSRGEVDAPIRIRIT